MVAPRYRSRSKRRVFIKTPGNVVKIHYRARKPSKAICGKCGDYLNGVPRAMPNKMKNLPKTCKRPERPYGGVLCTKCMRKLFKEAARSK